MRPNILIIHTHDLGRFPGCYGNKTVHSPNLDRLAAEGVLFRRAFCAAPQCSPARAALFTGYPHQTGVPGLTHNFFKWRLNNPADHVVMKMRAAGYRSASEPFSVLGVMKQSATD